MERSRVVLCPRACGSPPPPQPRGGLPPTPTGTRQGTVIQETGGDAASPGACCLSLGVQGVWRRLPGCQAGPAARQEKYMSVCSGRRSWDLLASERFSLKPPPAARDCLSSPSPTSWSPLSTALDRCPAPPPRPWVLENLSPFLSHPRAPSLPLAPPAGSWRYRPNGPWTRGGEEPLL